MWSWVSSGAGRLMHPFSLLLILMGAGSHASHASSALVHGQAQGPSQPGSLIPQHGQASLRGRQGESSPGTS